MSRVIVLHKVMGDLWQLALHDGAVREVIGPLDTAATRVAIRKYLAGVKRVPAFGRDAA